MKKVLTLFLVAVAALTFAACADDASSPVAPSYTPAVTESYTPTPTTTTTTNRTTMTAPTPTYTTPAATNYDQPTYSSTVYYDVIVGGVCQAMNVRVTGTLSGSCQSDATASFVNWAGTCNIESMHPAEYDNYTLTQIKNILLTQLSFDTVLTTSIINQAERCGSAMYIYNATSGLNFLYIERVGDGKGLMKRH